MAPFLFAVDEDVPGGDIVVRTSQIGRQSNLMEAVPVSARCVFRGAL